MPVEEATDAETEAMLRRARRYLAWLWAQKPGIAGRDVVETIGIALRLLHSTASAEFRREMLKYLAANLAEMQEADA